MKKLYKSMWTSHLYSKIAMYALTLLFFTGGGVISLQAADQQKTQPVKKIISISMTNATLENILLQIRKESNYYILYNSDAVGSIKNITIKKTDATIESILDHCLEGTNLEYAVKDDSIVIKAKSGGKTASVNKTNQFVIKGTITSKATKTPLVGAMAYVQGTQMGCVSDAKGEYFLILDKVANQTIVFSFIGMESKDVVYNGQPTIDIALSEKVESIDDVVVTGYANIRKEGFTGNTTRISREDLVKVSPKNIIQAIQVFDPSFRIAENITMGSNPNNLPEFYIRGRNSINFELNQNDADISRQNLQNNPNLPIFILDGFEVDVAKVYDMDPSRIHSTTLLKDAAATALYGSRAANGVVVIESRAPEAGKLRISYNLTGSVEVPDLSSYNLTNARECLQAELDSDFYKPVDINDPTSIISSQKEYLKRLNDVNRGVDTYWLSQSLRTALNHKHSLYIDGGENDVRWGIELRYDNQAGVMKNSKRNTYGGELFLDYRIGKFQIMNRASFDAMKKDDAPIPFSTYAHLLPYNSMRDDITGLYSEKLKNGGVNPVYEDHYLNNFINGQYQDYANKFAINFYGSKDFTVKGWIAIQKRYGSDKTFIDPLSSLNTVSSNSEYKGKMDAGSNDSFSYDGNLLFLYNKNINKHYINLSLGTNIRETNENSLLSTYKGFSSGGLTSPNDALMIDGKPRQNSNKTRLFGVLFTANYTYDNIYLLDLSGRLDSSSEFGSKNRTAPFYSTGVGINIHNYEFMKDSPISRLKVRASYGMLGKVGFSAYAAKTSYMLSNTDYWYPTGIGQLLYYMGNEDLGWEKTNVTDIGFDLGLFDNKIQINASYYNKLTVDQITSITLPSSSGFTQYMDNLGKIRNRGFEVDIRAQVYKDKNWSLDVFGNVSHNKNKIMEISDALKSYNQLVQSQYDKYEENGDDIGLGQKFAKTYTQYVEGSSLTSIFGMKSLGINPANGKEVFLKSNGTITYDWNAAEQTVIGNTEPTAQGTFGFNASWKNFTVFTTFMFEFGGQRYNSTLITEVENARIGHRNLDKRVTTDRWVNVGDFAPLKSLKDKNYVTRPTSRFVQDFNTLKFNSLSISYDFNQKIIKKAGMSMLRLTANMQDLSYWSTVMQERGLSYPYSRIVNFTVNVTF